MVPNTSSPRTATRSFGNPKCSARLSAKFGSFPPPPTINTALTGTPPFNSIIRSATFFVVLETVSCNPSNTSSGANVCAIPIMSLYSIFFSEKQPIFISSAVEKSTR